MGKDQFLGWFVLYSKASQIVVIPPAPTSTVAPATGISIPTTTTTQIPTGIGAAAGVSEALQIIFVISILAFMSGPF